MRILFKVLYEMSKPAMKKLVLNYAPAALLGGDCHFNAPSPVSSPNSPSLVRVARRFYTIYALLPHHWEF